MAKCVICGNEYNSETHDWNCPHNPMIPKEQEHSSCVKFEQGEKPKFWEPPTGFCVPPIVLTDEEISRKEMDGSQYARKGIRTAIENIDLNGKLEEAVKAMEITTVKWDGPIPVNVTWPPTIKNATIDKDREFARQEAERIEQMILEGSPAPVEWQTPKGQECFEKAGLSVKARKKLAEEIEEFNSNYRQYTENRDAFPCYQPVDTTVMQNTKWRTKKPRKLTAHPYLPYGKSEIIKFLDNVLPGKLVKSFSLHFDEDGAYLNAEMVLQEGEVQEFLSQLSEKVAVEKSNVEIAEEVVSSLSPDATSVSKEQWEALQQFVVKEGFSVRPPTET